jgi:methylglutaconyl-CoA hydratase
MSDAKEHRTIVVNRSGPLLTITLNRPEVHNAFNEVMIAELHEAIDRIVRKGGVRVVVLTGMGRSFCAGADLNWMRRVKDYSYEENLAESRQLADLMYGIYALPVPTVARVNGAAIGGGTGFLAACDVVIAAETATFSLSEVKLGLVPAVISPYVIRRVGESRCRQLMLTGERFKADRAGRYGLVNTVVPIEDLDNAVTERVAQLLSSGPEALKTCKELLHRVPLMDFQEARDYTAEVIARLRISPEGQEGMAAFLDKRKPSWNREP